jgi:hypothetical protein
VAEPTQRGPETLTQARAAPVAPPADGAAGAAPGADGRPPSEVSPPSDQGGGEPASPRGRALGSRRLRLVVIPIVIIIGIIAGGIGLNYYLNNLWYVSTDNAQVMGTPVPVGATSVGTIEEIPVQVGQAVQRGQLLASVLLPVQSNSPPSERRSRRARGS